MAKCMEKAKFVSWISLALALGLAAGCHSDTSDTQQAAEATTAPAKADAAAQLSDSGEMVSPWRKLGAAVAGAQQQQQSTKGIRHTDFAAFWVDFRKAVLAKDKSAVAALAHFPFEDGNDLYGTDKSLACADAAVFLQQYDLIFSPPVLAAIKANQHRGYRPVTKDETEEDTIGEDDHVLEVGFDERSRTRDLLFRKVGGTYKLVGLPYYP